MADIVKNNFLQENKAILYIIFGYNIVCYKLNAQKMKQIDFIPMKIRPVGQKFLSLYIWKAFDDIPTIPTHPKTCPLINTIESFREQFNLVSLLD